MKFVPGFILALVGLAVLAPASAFPTDWKQKPYFDASTSELKLQTTAPVAGFEDCAWKVPQAGTTYTGPDTFRQPLAWTDFTCPAHVLWAKECKPGRQTVEFTKTIYLPGRPSDLDVSLVSFHDAPLSMWIEINGTVALRAPESVHKRDLREKEALFKVGMNRITVEATKPRTGKPCNIGTFDYGVLMQMRAVFANDFLVTPPPVGKASTYQAPLTVENAGPSAASMYSVSFGAYTPNLATKQTDWGKVAIIITGPGIEISKCYYGYTSIAYKGKNYLGYTTTCPVLEPFEAGESRTYHVTFGYKPPSATYFEQFPITWGASGDLLDPRPGNGQGARLAYACKPAHPPECKN